RALVLELEQGVLGPVGQDAQVEAILGREPLLAHALETLEERGKAAGGAGAAGLVVDRQQMVRPVLADRGGVHGIGGEKVLDELLRQGRERGVGRQSLHGYPHRERHLARRAITLLGPDDRTAELSGAQGVGSRKGSPARLDLSARQCEVWVPW